MGWKEWLQSDKGILACLVVVFMATWVVSQHDPVMRMADLTLGALIGLVTGKIRGKKS